jgi:hypothetical protein
VSEGEQAAQVKAQGRRITILGMGPTANERRLDILRYCRGTEIHGLNNGYLVFPHLRGQWSRMYELHAWGYLKDWKAGDGVDHWRALDALECPVWSVDPLPVIRDQHRLDMVAVCRALKSNYFLGSPSIMLMHALWEHDLDKAAGGPGIAYIQSYGIDTMDERHAQQRASWAYWCRAAQERSIDMGGTALDYMGEPERDDGLRGLREDVGNALMEQDRAAKAAADEAAAAEAAATAEQGKDKGGTT